MFLAMLLGRWENKGIQIQNIDTNHSYTSAYITYKIELH